MLLQKGRQGLRSCLWNRYAFKGGIKVGALRSLIICFAVFSKIPMPYIDWEKKDMKYIFAFCL